MACFARPLAEDDLELLAAMDGEYALRMGLEPQLTRASLSFYLRTGHSFVAIRQAQPVGFVLGQAIWNGIRPTVYVNQLVSQDADDIEVREAMLEAVIKSAYDSAVYDIELSLPEADTLSHQAARHKTFIAKPVKSYRRGLGSRAAGF